MAAGGITPSLDRNSIPQIVVTKPTPLTRSPSTMTVMDRDDFYHDDDDDDDELQQPTIAEQISQRATAVDFEDIIDHFARDSIEDYTSASQRGFLCNHTARVLPADVRVGIAGDERNIPGDPDDYSRSGSEFSATYGGLQGCCERCPEYTTSIYALFMWFLLLVLPISAGFMGARYLKECRMSPALPALLFMMGVSGVVMIKAKILLIIHDAVWEEEFGQPCLQTTVAVTCMITFLLFCTELMCFWRYSPSFDIISPEFCDSTFYNYTYWMNWVMVVLHLLPPVILITRWLLVRQNSS